MVGQQEACARPAWCPARRARRAWAADNRGAESWARGSIRPRGGRRRTRPWQRHVSGAVMVGREPACAGTLGVYHRSAGHSKDMWISFGSWLVSALPVNRLALARLVRGLAVARRCRTYFQSLGLGVLRPQGAEPRSGARREGARPALHRASLGRPAHGSGGSRPGTKTTAVGSPAADTPGGRMVLARELVNPRLWGRGRRPSLEASVCSPESSLLSHQASVSRPSQPAGRLSPPRDPRAGSPAALP